MATSLEVKEFRESHPYPDKCDIKSLFKFYKFDLDRNGHLFTERKLYHSLPSQFNDPFECKPIFNLPKGTNKLGDIRQHLIKSLIREEGCHEKVAEEKASKMMEEPELFQEKIYESIQVIFAKARICSFTTQKENLLFWSHYADSHRGFCVEFDATKMPMYSAFKVQYEKEYPEAIYPVPNDETGLKPLLVKSKIWEYEEEFRTIFVPFAEFKPDNDGKSLILKGDEIMNVYLGSEMDEPNKKQVIDLVKRGNFNPSIWTTSLAKSTFSLEFDPLI